MPTVEVVSSKTKYSDEYITSTYSYSRSQVKIIPPDIYKVIPVEHELIFRTERFVPKLGVMLVGWGGNNGSTVTAAILANSLGISWETKDGLWKANYIGSLFQSSTISLGHSGTDEIFVPMREVVPMIHPNDIILDGWDISSSNLSDAMTRAKVLNIDLQRNLREHMKTLKPRPSIFDKNFIAANQSDRADNIIVGSKCEQIERIREDIKDFKTKNGISNVIVIWTANTERYSNVEPGLNDTWDNLSQSIHEGKNEISPSTLFAVASVLEGCAYINGAPQNTFVPGVIELAEKKGVFIGGDDFKSGQTKLKSVLVDFLISAGLKPVSIVSYNHLGNNDGKNLSAPEQFRSKEISKSNVVDDMVASNKILYEPGEKPDHCVVIKYVPYVGDSKRAMDEYTSEILLGGLNTLVIHNTCEDSLLAAPIILDLIMLTELFQRVKVKVGEDGDFVSFHSILSVLSFFLKAPLVRRGDHVVNAFSKQRFCIENILRALVGLSPINHMNLEKNLTLPDKQIKQTEKQTEPKKSIQIDLKNIFEISSKEGASF